MTLQMSFSFNSLPDCQFMDSCSGDMRGGGTQYGRRRSLLLHISCAVKPASGRFSAGLCLLLLQPQSTSWVSPLPLASGSVRELLTAMDGRQLRRPSAQYGAFAVVSSSLLCLALTIILPVSFWSDYCLSLGITVLGAGFGREHHLPLSRCGSSSAKAIHPGSDSLFLNFITHRMKAAQRHETGSYL